MIATKTIGIYSITHPIVKGSYIGKTTRSFAVRWEEHKDDLRSGTHANYKLQGIADQFGVDSLKFATVAECDREEILLEELKWIAKQGTWNLDPNQADAKRRLKPGAAPQKKGKRKKKSGVLAKLKRFVVIVLISLAAAGVAAYLLTKFGFMYALIWTVAIALLVGGGKK